MSFMGKTIAYDYFYPERSTLAEFDMGQGELEVGAGVEVTNSFYTLDIADNYIRFEFKDTGLFKLATFNGPVLEDRNGEINPFSKFSLVTNMSGLDRSDIKLTEDGIYINWRGAALTAKTYVQITFSFGENELVGSGGDDDLTGTDDADMINGRAGDDMLRSDAIDDAGGDVPAMAARSRMPAASDADSLYGGAGKDTFVFATGDSARKRSEADTIFDFSPRAGETIDLTEWDANRREDGHQSFTFIGRQEFSGHAGELRYVIGRSDIWIEGETNGDGRADFTIRLDDAGKLRADNFAL